MSRQLKRRRKQPRRLTPPLFLRGAEGEREVVEVDHELVTRSTMTSGRVRAILVIAPGVHIRVGSRCINKKRVPVLRIEPEGYVPQVPELNGYAEAVADFNR